MKLLSSLLVGYLIGSVSIGTLLARYIAHIDISKAGSGNPGTTNILRTMGKKYALITFLWDFAKGILGAYIGSLICGNTSGSLLGGFGAVLGHNFPLYFHFKGGKGIATSFGAFLFIYPIQALLAFSLFLLITLITKYVSLGSIAASITLPLFILIMGHPDKLSAVLSVIFGILAIVRHHANIGRLVRHQENRLQYHKK